MSESLNPVNKNVAAAPAYRVHSDFTLESGMARILNTAANPEYQMPEEFPEGMWGESGSDSSEGSASADQGVYGRLLEAE